MTAAWQALTDELDAWTAVGRQATLWWRDDDATEETPALKELLSLAGEFDAPVSLAVIPTSAKPGLADLLETQSADTTVLLHGYRHDNQAKPDAKKSEFPAERDLDDMLGEIESGLARLRGLFGHRALAVLVPPWNRIAGGLVQRLPEAGFKGLSAYADNMFEISGPPPDYVQVNSHADIIDWRGGRGFVGEEISLDLLRLHLAARREGSSASGGPTGLLTHHLVHDRDAWDFITRLLAETTGHPAVRWLGAGEVFKAASPPRGDLRA